MKTVYMMFVLLFLLLLGGCDKLFDYSPYAIDFGGEDVSVNSTNINKLTASEESDTIQIAFTGDSHNYFDELNTFIDKVNTMKSIDFVIHVGDITDFGLPKQYLWGNSALLRLKIPYQVVIGNHDLVGNGMEVYLSMFGELDYAFVYQDIKFVFVNTNSLEFAYNGKVPNLIWLNQQLLPSDYFTKAVVVFHMPPGVGFDPNLESGFYEAIAKNNNVILAVHGHAHHFEVYFPINDSIPFVNVYGAEYNKMTSIKIFKNEIYIENIPF